MTAGWCDWSDLTPDQRWHWLRASVAVEGRSVTLYEEVHPQHRLGNPKLHRQFLARVAELLPSGCAPIVMSDAGFHAAWFKAVSAQGWAFIGRIRGRDMVQHGARPWIRATALYEQATAQPQDLGQHTYVRSNPISVAEPYRTETKKAGRCRPQRGMECDYLALTPCAFRSSWSRACRYSVKKPCIRNRWVRFQGPTR